jgi:hypothetical protein
VQGASMILAAVYQWVHFEHPRSTSCSRR